MGGVRTVTAGLAALVLAVHPSALHSLTLRSQDVSPPTFTSRAELVVLHVNVRRADGGFVSALPRDAFTVLEDGQPQPVELFLEQDTPVTVGLVVDNSISMHANRELVVAAAGEFARAGHERDARFAIVFNERVTSALPPARPFTADAQTLEQALMLSITARGRTAFFDAVVQGLAYTERGEHPRRVLVVIGDGGDNESAVTYAQMLRRAQAANVVVYTVTLADPLDREARPERMKELAAVTGGEPFLPRSRTDVSRVLRQIADDIRHTYTLAYAPTRPADDTLRRVRVIVSPPARQRLTVRTRTAYFAESRRPEPTP